ncbi:hypothetical protein OSTOST_18982, partial [Ostertagia ostertagi]
MLNASITCKLDKKIPMSRERLSEETICELKDFQPFTSNCYDDMADAIPPSPAESSRASSREPLSGMDEDVRTSKEGIGTPRTPTEISKTEESGMMKVAVKKSKTKNVGSKTSHIFGRLE